MNKKIEKVLSSSLTISLAAGVSGFLPMTAGAATLTTTQKYNAAVAAVAKAKKDNTQASVDAAKKAIAALKGTSKASKMAGLTSQVASVQAIINAIGKASAAITTATTSLSQADLNKAIKAAASPLIPAKYATSFDASIDAVQANIDAEKTAESTATAAVVKAEASKAQADVDAATTAVSAVKVATVKAALTARIAAIVVPTSVVSVNAINATQVEIKFNKAVDKATLFADGVSGTLKSTATVTLTSLDLVSPGSLSVVLSSDGKTLTITAANVLSKRYDVVVDGLKSTDGSAVTKYAQTVTFAADTTAPTILSTVQTSASTFKVTFSEPMHALGAFTYKLADGSAATVTSDFAAGKSEVNFTLDAAIAVGATVTATFVAAQDQNLNLITPNPASVTFVKGAKDGVAPTVSSYTQTGAKTFAVKFSEKLLATPTITVNNSTPVSVIVDANDATVYNVTTSAVLYGVYTIGVSSITDLSNEAGTNTSKVVTFTKALTAPSVASYAVVTDSTDAKQYLEITFDRNVDLSTPTVAAVGTKIKDFVTTGVTISATSIAYKDSANHKVVRVALPTLLAGSDVDGAVYGLTLTFAGVTSEAAVPSNTATVTFTRGTDSTPTNTTVLAAPVVAAGSDNNKVTVTFTGAVDGASATNVANYKIDGAVVSSVTLAPLSNGTQVATLNLLQDSNAFTGLRNVTVSGVKALNSSVTMNTYSTTVNIKENVAPKVKSAALGTASSIVVTFTEAVKSSTATNGVVNDGDFVVYVDGVVVSQASAISSITDVVTGTTITLNLSSALSATDLTKTITIKKASANDVVDANLNILASDTITVAK